MHPSLSSLLLNVLKSQRKETEKTLESRRLANIRQLKIQSLKSLEVLHQTANK